RHEVLRGGILKTRVDPDRGVEVRVGDGEDVGHRTTGRHAHDVDAAAVQLRPAGAAEDLPGDRRDLRGLSEPADLVERVEPVPAASRVVEDALLGVDD